MTSRGLATDFSASIEAFAGGHIDAAQLTASFARETVYIVRPSGPPAVITLVGDDDNEYLPAWSSLTSMATTMGDVSWIACTGADLLTVLPADVGLMLDPASETCLVLPPSALGSGVTLEVVGR